MHPVELVEPAHLVLEVSTARDDVHANRINVGADSRDDHDRFTSERSILPDVTAVIPKRCRPYDRTWHSILEVHVILPYHTVRRGCTGSLWTAGDRIVHRREPTAPRRAVT